MGNLPSRFREKPSGDHTELREYNEYGDAVGLVAGGNAKPPAKEDVKNRIFKILIAMSSVFIVLNLMQIGLIHQVTNKIWIAGVPGVLFVGFTLLLLDEWRRSRSTIKDGWRDSSWEDRLPKIGIIATVFLNILAVEFGYLNAVAVPAANEKVWKISVAANDGLSLPGMALIQTTYYPGRAVIASNQQVLESLYYGKTHPASNTPVNQAAFTKFVSYSVTPPLGVDAVSGADVNYVTFNGSLPGYPLLNVSNDIYLYYQFYVNDQAYSQSLRLAAFDKKFLKNDDLFQKALRCGVIKGGLFDAASTSQLSLEQLHIKDEVEAIDFELGYPSNCSDPEFRDYITYRYTLIDYGPVYANTGCNVSGSAPPDNQLKDPPCYGAIDVQSQSMLVTTETSQYSKSRVSILTDKGGIVGGIMFITWFFSIMNQ